ncbi:DNA-directed RNA polymerase subunit alpha C-terminal domain-containing protein [Paraburkholderia terrae]|uniref:RNA polymerase alpha subunit C-terminal domain-containing protein n=1 Tax=Paraburkholderia terrae TaxID=311230 RepID=A0A2I8ETZ2_9BURK|nr:DNA-directed RNA polymerase subunit alpha C-terminal domain-containing protein [Paraburkholderia terrae]AUT62908.1 hypothetical protein C2L65_25395 [Paraburkholderia terrae]
MKRRTSLTIGVNSTLDELESARMYIDHLVEKAKQPPSVTRPATKLPRLAALGMAKSVTNALRDAEITTVDALVKHSVQTLLHVPGLGMKSILQIQQALSERGLALHNGDTHP